MHHIDLFRQGVQHHMPLGGVDFQGSTAFAAWLVDDGIELFKKAFRQETGRAITSLPEGLLIEQAYPKGMNEIEKKQGQQVFYTANAQIFADTCLWIATAVVKAHSDPRAEPFASRHYGLLKNMVLDAQTLLADWAALSQGVSGMYGIGKSGWHGAFQISHATEQLMFVGSPFFAFTDNATDSGTALLRVALETRLRFGFGLLGVLEKASQTVSPLNLSTVFQAIAVHESKMQLAVPQQHIDRIYGWANIYVHVGLKHFGWSPIVADRYLNPLLRGGQHQGGSSIHAGIRIDKATLAAVQAQAEITYKLDPTYYELIKISPEQCAVLLMP
jgi:hypothetical protein